MLWIRLDPDITILRSTVIEQPDYQWQYQLRHERDVTAQLDAIAALERYPTPASRLALTDTIENEQTYLQVRCKAAHCLTKVSTIILYYCTLGELYSIPGMRAKTSISVVQTQTSVIWDCQLLIVLYDNHLCCGF